MHEDIHSLIENNQPFGTAAGVKVTPRDYLNIFLSTYDLNPCDYYTAGFLFKAAASGKDIQPAIEQLQATWAILHNSLGDTPSTIDEGDIEEPSGDGGLF